MRVVMSSAPQPFLTRAEPLLKTDPFTTSVITTVTTRIASGAVPNSGENLWHTIEGAHGDVIGVAMHTPPYNMFLSRMPRDAAIALAHDVTDRRRELPGVNGASESTAAFAEAWEAITGCSSRVDRAMRMYRLADLIWPEAVLGKAYRAELSETGMVAEWFAEFHDEAQPDAPVDDWTAMAQRRIEAGDVHLWRAEDATVALRQSARLRRVSHGLDPSTRLRAVVGMDTAAASRRRRLQQLSALVPNTSCSTPI